MSHFLDQQFKNDQQFDVEDNFFRIDNIKTRGNILTEPKAEMITYPPGLERKCCSKNCSFNILALPLCLMVLLVFIATIYYTRILK